MFPFKLLPMFVAVLVSTALACYFKTKVDKSELHLGKSMPFNSGIFTRNLSVHPCVCGEDFPGIPVNLPNAGVGHPVSYVLQPWILYIHLHLSHNKSGLCVGTIVNSNMVITSHRCLQKRDRISVPDVFLANQQLPDSALASVKDITLSTDWELADKTNVNFTVKKIVYSERFAYESMFESAPESDVAILVVDYDFTKPNNFSNMSKYPICIPSYGQLTTKRILNKKAHYQGIYSWNGTNIKYSMGIHNFSYIMTAEDCNNASMLGVKPTNNETLCMMFTQPGPTVEGGPLRINVKRFIEGGPYRSFLVGLASWVDKTEMNAGHKYAYFSNINSIVKYIEHQATAQGSSWCSTPHPDDTIWPWEHFEGGEERSLDCECGKQPYLEPGRIIGGQDAGILEFPWLIKLFVSHNASNPGDVSLCGGSIINDRMILTAAHCFARLDQFRQKDSLDFHYVPNNPSIHGIFIHSYFLKNDTDTEIGLVYQVFAKQILFHPGYPDEAREARYDFDIALIILNQSLTLGKSTDNYLRLDPVCLPEKGYLHKIIGENVTVAGWGLTDPNDTRSTSPTLKKLNVPIRPINDCLAVGLKIGKNYQYPTDTRFCASYLQPWENAGQGQKLHNIVNLLYKRAGILTLYLLLFQGKWGKILQTEGNMIVPWGWSTF